MKTDIIWAGRFGQLLRGGFAFQAYFALTSNIILYSHYGEVVDLKK
jgi:hypothetical protein